MYCKNCKQPVTATDEYCSNCSETLTEFTRINTPHEIDSPKQDSITQNIQETKGKKGKGLIITGWVLIGLQIISYLGSTNYRTDLDGPSSIGYFFGRNFLIIIGIIFLIKGSSK